jgi:hypothetical protein
MTRHVHALPRRERLEYLALDLRILGFERGDLTAEVDALRGAECFELRDPPLELQQSFLAIDDRINTSPFRVAPRGRPMP